MDPDASAATAGPRVHRLGLLACLLLGGGFLFFPGTLAAPAQTASEEKPPARVQELIGLLGDPEVQKWLSQHRPADPVAEPPPGTEETTASGYLSGRLGAIHGHVTSLATALPHLPDEFRRANDAVERELQGRRGIGTLLVTTFVVVGFGAEWLFRRATAKIRRRFDEVHLETARDRLRVAAARLAYGVCLLAAFALGSVGAFVAFAWPPFLREMVLGYLMAFLVVRMTLVLGRFLLAPDQERFRLVPMDTPAAWFWYRRLAVFVGWFAFGSVTVGLLGTLGFAAEARQLVAYGLGLGLLAIGLEAVWRAPAAVRDPRPAAPQASRVGRTLWRSLVSVFFVLLWALWVASAMPTFWFAVIVAALLLLRRTLRRSIDHLLRPAGAAAHVEGDTSSLLAVGIERGAQAVLVIGAALLLARAWKIDLIALAAQDTAFTRLIRGGLSAVIIVLLADFAWHMLKTAIDRKLAGARDLGAPNTDDSRRRARLRTLLPIARNVLFIVVVVFAAMMALSAMGVEIGPLIAGAGVIGVAIGFGSQTLVRDIISGMFYLLDDAFRVGEYIQSGNYKGTVESFSLRSVKLRHHRGPISTVPFGMLGAVQNMSRDWVIEKLEVGVTYDTDLELAKKLIKQIGRELAQDPEFAPHTIEPLKMQGVEKFGDFAIQLRMKMTTLPGEQFVIRRRAYAMLKTAFDANGIKFAFPTVQVAGGDSSSSTAAAAAGAAARRGLELTEPAPAQ
jgi:small-conductance mechanosensitive channel